MDGTKLTLGAVDRLRAEEISKMLKTLDPVDSTAAGQSKMDDGTELALGTTDVLEAERTIDVLKTDGADECTIMGLLKTEGRQADAWGEGRARGCRGARRA